MKILQVMAGAAQGGAETAFVDTCLALHEAGTRIEVVTRPNPLRVGLMRGAGLRVHELPFGGLWDIYTTHKIKRIIAKFEPHIVQTWMKRASYKTSCWEKFDKVSRYLTVARIGGYYNLKYYVNTEYFIAITDKISQYLLDNGIPRDRVRRINNFAEIGIPERPISRASLHTPEDAVLLLALGRLHEAKSFDILLRAVEIIPDVYLWIAGEGPLRDELEWLSADLGLTDRVRFLGWRGDRAALFKAADVCVLPSRYEPFGTVFVQAWAQKTPLVTTYTDGPREFVIDEENALVVPIDDVQALGNAIQRIIDDPDLKSRLTRNGYNRYREEFTQEKTVQAYLDFYREIFEKERLFGDLSAP